MSAPIPGGCIRCDPDRLPFGQKLSLLSGWSLADPCDLPLKLWVRKEAMELEDREAGWRYRCRFDEGRLGRRLARAASERLVRAIGYRGGHWVVADATGGFGRDAAVLAMAGCQVRLYERHPIVAAMVREALETAVAQQGPLQGLRRIDLRCADAIEALAKDEPRPDAIYIDPMFERHGSAQVRKTSQALRRLVGSTPDAEQLLEVALSHATQRVVVKRPAHAETLGSRAPASSLKQSSTRFDLYPVKSSYR